MLTNSAPIDTADKQIDISNKYGFSQKHTLANFRQATTKDNLCCLRQITIRATTKPTQKVIPITKDIVEFDAA